MSEIIKKDTPQYYTIKVEAEVPTTITFRVLASSPEEALEKLQYAVLTEPPKQNLNKMRKKSAKVYKYGTIEIQASKKY